MTTDSQQMDNRLLTDRTLAPISNAQGGNKEYYGRPEIELFSRLDALLMVTKSCKTESCRDPWSELFPGGQVNNIQDAMDSSYDAFFSSQPRISFSTCTGGHVIADEGPQNVLAYH